ncbi:uncharacterized protein LOC130771531 [Actinidia eriantha]|uniref:Transmembrane protein n=1 Tax=Actinidia rufa TaxID=165716 RepID=A0A7J0DZA8_9ERIC|nr:uncharacterized protein LOC130771531 [Actinidia eriantha]GFS45200.1 hypothetical protein Acr_00g0094810 [Actinidia rufa]
MCCGGRMCMLCTCVILVVIAIGFLFGFGVFKNGFHKLKDTLHYSDGTTGINNGTFSYSSSRPFLGFPAPPPF